MYVYLLPVGDIPLWALSLAISSLYPSCNVVNMGKMPEPEFTLTLITDRPIPALHQKALHLEPLE